MNVIHRLIYTGILVSLCWTSPIKAQEAYNLFEYGSTYINETNGPDYFRPLANGLNNALHSGLFPASDFEDKFHFYFGVNASMSFIPDKAMTFDGTTEAPYTPETTLEVPTVFGPNEAIVLDEGDGGEVYVFPGGFEMDKLLLGVPQISIGGVANTNLTVRFLAIPLDDEIGDADLLGIAVQHNLSPYIGLENFIVTFEAAYHKFKMGDWLDSDVIMARSSVIKTFDNARVYGFLGYQKGNLDLVNTQDDITVTSKSDNSLLFGVGGTVELAVINLNFECLVNSFITINAGLGFKF